MGTASPIERIRAEYQRCQDALPAYEEQSIDLEGFSPEGGKATAYRSKDRHLRLIKVWLYFESGRTVAEYYFKDGELYFVYDRHHRYNVPVDVTPEVAGELDIEPFDVGKTSILERRHYFSGGKMIRWLDVGKRRVDPRAKEYTDTEGEILGFSAKMVSLFKRSPSLIPSDPEGEKPDGRVRHMGDGFDSEEERQAREAKSRQRWEKRLRRELEFKLQLMRAKTGMQASQEAEMRDLLTDEYEERQRLVGQLADKEITRSAFDEAVRANAAQAQARLKKVLTAQQLQVYVQLKLRDEVLEEEKIKPREKVLEEGVK